MVDHSQNILAIDPGWKTGVAIKNLNDHITTTSVVPRQGIFEFLDRHLIQGCLVLYEDFILRPGMQFRTRQYDALHIIGAIKFVCHTRKLQCVAQCVSAVKFVIDDARLKRENFWDGLSSHERDAVRHLIYYLNT